MAISKKYKQTRLLLGFLVISVLLLACSGKSRLRDLQAYIDGLKKSISTQTKQEYISTIKAPQPVVFQADQKQRDPFVEEQASYNVSGAGGSPLTAYPIRQFEYVGMIDEDQKTWAVVKAPDNKTYNVTINDHIGDHYGRIVKIYADRVEIEEKITGAEAEGQNNATRIVSLPLKGKS